MKHLLKGSTMKLLRKAISAISTLLVILLVFLAYGSLGNRWYRVVTVEGNSMSPTLWFGDLMVVTPPPEEIPLNSIVVMSVEGSLVTHRFFGYDPDGRPITKGDANQVIDHFTNPSLRIVGICRLRLPGFGYPMLYLSQLLGRA
jgi:signal peptidase I